MWSGLHPKADFGGSTGDVAEVPEPAVSVRNNPPTMGTLQDVQRALFRLQTAAWSHANLCQLGHWGSPMICRALRWRAARAHEVLPVVILELANLRDYFGKRDGSPPKPSPACIPYY